MGVVSNLVILSKFDSGWVGGRAILVGVAFLVSEILLLFKFGQKL